jgi:hypothetical protein
MTLRLFKIAPESGPASGGDFVRIAAEGLGDDVTVRFGEAAGEVLRRLSFAGGVYLDVRTPGHEPETVDVTVASNGQVAVLARGYRFARAPLLVESDVTRITRKLLRLFKAEVLENTALTTAVDFSEEGVEAIAVAELPAVVLTGPRLLENRFYATNESGEETWEGALRRRRLPQTRDLEFGVTVASTRASELLNLEVAVARFVHRHPYLSLPRNPADPFSDSVRWEMDPVGMLNVNLEQHGEVRAFSWALVVRGVDVDEGLPLDLAAKLEQEPHLTLGGLE